MIPKQKLDTIRAVYDGWWAAVQAGVDPDDFEEQMGIELLTSALVGFVPDLIAEIERLRADRPEPEARMVKMDRIGGRA